MPEYGFRAVDRDNRVTEGRMTAGNAAAVAERLHSAGKIPLRIAVADEGASARMTRPFFAKGQLSQRAVSGFFIELRLLLRSGVDLSRALGFLARSARDERARGVLKAVHANVERGGTLSGALSDASPGLEPFLLSTLRAGEVSGQLDAVLERLGGYLERRAKLRAELLSALIYPAILLVLAAVAVGILMTVLIPEFRPLFEDAGAELPALTQAVLAVSDAATRYGFLAIAGMALLCVAAWLVFRDGTWRLWLDKTKLDLPLLGPLSQKIQVSHFARLMSLLLENGVTIEEALALARQAAPNRAVGAALADARQHVREGRRLSDVLGTHGRMFPALSLDLLRIGEEASNLTGSLARIADLFEAEVERSVRRLMDLLVPALTVVLGGVIATVIFSVLFAMLSLNDLALR